MKLAKICLLSLAATSAAAGDFFEAPALLSTKYVPNKRVYESKKDAVTFSGKYHFEKPTDLAFRPESISNSKLPLSLWVVNYNRKNRNPADREKTGGWIVTIENPGVKNRLKYRKDRLAVHYMHKPTALSFSPKNDEFATCHDSLNFGYSNGFMGPTLWRSSTYAIKNQKLANYPDIEPNEFPDKTYFNLGYVHCIFLLFLFRDFSHLFSFAAHTSICFTNHQIAWALCTQGPKSGPTTEAIMPLMAAGLTPRKIMDRSFSTTLGRTIKKAGIFTALQTC